MATTTSSSSSSPSPPPSNPQCQFWLPKKKRFCSLPPLHHTSFCGNHSTRSNKKWMPCPIDSSHSVLEDNLQSHLTKCPLHKQALSLSLQPYYHKGINAPRPEEPADPVTSELKRQSIHDKTVAQFFDFIRKIKTIHASVASMDIQDSFRIPDACAIWTDRQVDQKLPFQAKHALQQASILGNMEHFGMLEKCGVGDVSSKVGQVDVLQHSHHEVPAVVEFGAGRGYLTQMLADCYGIKKVILVERKSYKLKADRSLRQIESLQLERLRIDIEDLNLNAVESLRGVSYLAIGKHLCGPATDMMLRCCISQQSKRDNGDERKGRCLLRGLAVATCCHHLCQWKHYINKNFMSNLGVSKEEFHGMTWLTSWAVDTEREYDLSEIDEWQHMKIIEKEEFGGEVGEVIRNMNPGERAVVGLMCKDIIDVGRLIWLKERGGGGGLRSEILKYVPPSVSPENHLLIASAAAGK